MLYPVIVQRLLLVIGQALIPPYLDVTTNDGIILTDLMRGDTVHVQAALRQLTRYIMGIIPFYMSGKNAAEPTMICHDLLPFTSADELSDTGF
jgi:hypothetical protein